MRTLLAALFALTFCVRSHAVIISYYDLIGTAGAGLLPGNETPVIALGGTGGEIGAGIFLDDGDDADPNTNFLTVSNVGWGSSQGFTDLTSAANNSHIHGPTSNNFGFNGTANFTQTAGVLFNLTRSSNLATGGTFTSAPISLTAANVGDLNNGKFYINIHTGNNGGGELRGFIVPVPEPGSFGAMALGLAGLIGLRRIRVRSMATA
jgi:hypothetical protein